MKKRVDDFLPRAFEAINRTEVKEKTFFKDRSRGVIYKEYKGYISSLGANIVLAGVKAAITFYQAEESGSEQDRKLVNAAINYILENPNPAPSKYDNYKLTHRLNGDEQQIQSKAMEILDAATALKLALRTYKMK